VPRDLQDEAGGSNAAKNTGFRRITIRSAESILLKMLVSPNHEQAVVETLTLKMTMCALWTASF
jgi:hypothetical protein